MAFPTPLFEKFNWSGGPGFKTLYRLESIFCKIFGSKSKQGVDVHLFIQLFIFYVMTMPIAYGHFDELDNCGGTEPFWSISFEKGRGKLDKRKFSFDHGLNVDPYAGFSNVEGQRLIGKFENGKPIRVYTLRRSCGDGMSDFSYEYSILVEFGNSLLSGCCNQRSSYRVSGLKKNDTLNIRLKPGTKKMVLGELKEGDVVVRHDCKGQWCLVSTSPLHGWVHKSYLKPYTP